MSESTNHMPFVENVEDFTCGICLGVLDRATNVCKHNHLFCQSCIERTRENHNSTCPNCREEIIWKATAEGPRVVPGRMEIIDKLIATQWVRCPHGCEETFPLKKLNEHNESCLDREVSCPYESMGCQHSCKRRHLAAHVRDENPQHLALVLKHFDDESEDLKFAVSRTTRLVKSAYQHSGGIMLSRFDSVDKVVGGLHARVGRLESKLDALMEGVSTLINQNTTAKPTAAKKGKAAGKRTQQDSAPEEAVLKRLRVSDKPYPPLDQAPSPFGASSGRAPSMPSLEYPEAMLSADDRMEAMLSADDRLPALEHPLGSPAYSPSSPAYSPTSPAYSPTGV